MKPPRVSKPPLAPALPPMGRPRNPCALPHHSDAIRPHPPPPNTHLQRGVVPYDGAHHLGTGGRGNQQHSHDINTA
jgi:hypothetical protein